METGFFSQADFDSKYRELLDGLQIVEREPWLAVVSQRLPFSVKILDNGDQWYLYWKAQGDLAAARYDPYSLHPHITPADMTYYLK